ncbi:MAG TPA: DUF3618 domain-containing protein [Gaiellaceae bacterium]|nr:DUF3618 domain-containing protein [Gaiellaceae bacterium]
MPDRSVEEIRLEIASERQALATDLDALHDEVRSVVPFAVGTLIAVALLANEKRLRSGFKLLWKLL